jgi:hypothetical protein
LARLEAKANAIERATGDQTTANDLIAEVQEIQNEWN